MKKILSVLLVLTLTFALMGCGQETKGNVDSKIEKTTVVSKEEKSFENKNYVSYVDVSDISKDVKSLGGDYSKYYTKWKCQ